MRVESVTDPLELDAALAGVDDDAARLDLLEFERLIPIAPATIATGTSNSTLDLKEGS